MKRHLLLCCLLFCWGVGLAAAQSRQLTGVVKASSGEPLPGVTVLVKGTTSTSTVIDLFAANSVPNSGVELLAFPQTVVNPTSS